MKKIIFIVIILNLIIITLTTFEMQRRASYQKELKRLQEINYLFEQDMKGEIELSNEDLEKLILEFNLIEKK